MKCPLCRASGKKSNMIICVDCKQNFHISCVEDEKELPKRYTCDKCRF